MICLSIFSDESIDVEDEVAVLSVVEVVDEEVEFDCDCSNAFASCMLTFPSPLVSARSKFAMTFEIRLERLLSDYWPHESQLPFVNCKSR